MKLHIFILTLGVLLSSVRADIAWTHKITEGEDATSTSYYFYQSNGDSVERVWSVWNGGAQNPPEVTDYKFEGGGIRIRHLKGTREKVRDLVNGRECKLEVVSEYVLKNGSSDAILVPAGSDEPLSDAQRSDLSNLIYLLAKDRKPIVPLMEITCKPQFELKPDPRNYVVDEEGRQRDSFEHWLILDDGKNKFRILWKIIPISTNELNLSKDETYTFTVQTLMGDAEPSYKVIRITKDGKPVYDEAEKKDSNKAE